MKRIVLTGGGTAGHITPNIALLDALKKNGFEVSYIGGKNSMEQELLQKEGIPFYGVSTGKLRRYFSMKNITDMFRVVQGVREAAGYIKKVSPSVIFSKGGFVAVPVVLGARLSGVPVVIHESDMTPGLANKIAMPFADVVCTTFPETAAMIPKKKGIHTGTPIRKELFQGDKKRGLSLCGFSSEKPTMMMMGGSLGSVKINTVLRKALPELLKSYQVVHICGKNNVEQSLLQKKGYKQFAYVSEELPHIFAAADFIVSRAGSNSISEILALKKPNLLIPLSQKASRGDQILNAASFEKQGFSLVLPEEEMDEKTLVEKIALIYKNRADYIKNMEKSQLTDSVGTIVSLLSAYGKQKGSRNL